MYKLHFTMTSNLYWDKVEHSMLQSADEPSLRLSLLYVCVCVIGVKVAYGFSGPNAGSWQD